MQNLVVLGEAVQPDGFFNMDASPHKNASPDDKLYLDVQKSCKMVPSAQINYR